MTWPTTRTIEPLNSISFSRFDTICELTADVNERVLAEAETLCERLDCVYSRFNPDSLLYRVNANAGSWVNVDDRLARALACALHYCKITDGLFDVTMGNACALWDFKQGVCPTEEQMAAACAHIDWRQIDIDGTRVRIRDPKTAIDLGGVAKGIIADELAAFLVNKGATSGYVNLGGNVQTIGVKPTGEPWMVGLRTPAPAPDLFRAPTFAAVAVCGKSVVTSGIFERAFAYDGQLLHHILDPRTSAPAVTDVLSASVISNTSTDGDGCTTALVVMGSAAAVAFAEKTPGIEAVIYTADDKILHTQGLTWNADERLFTWNEIGGKQHRYAEFM